MIVTDTSGCVDSSFTTTTITTNAAQLRDQNNLLSYTPTWINCIQLAAAPDSFQITTSSNDTLRRPIFIWGDGSPRCLQHGSKIQIQTSAIGSLQLAYSRCALYNAAALVLIPYMGQLSTCVSLRAGLIGPGSNNAGCVPHTP